MRAVSHRRRLVSCAPAAALAAALVLGLAACTATSASLPAAREGRSGLQGTGTIDGKQVAVATGLPQLLVGDCDPLDGRDSDVCVIADTIDGRQFVLAFENPAALVEGAVLPVVDPGCEPEACEELTDVAIVTVKLDTDRSVRATGGTVRVRRVVTNLNYAADLSLSLPGGDAFNGQMDVVPRPE